MKLKGWPLLLGVTAVAVGWSVFEVQKEESESKRKIETSQIVKFKTDQIQTLEIQRTLIPGSETGSSEIVRLVRKDEGWKIESPMTDLADAEAVKSFVDDLVDEKSSQVVAEGDTIDFKVFGLDQPAGFVRLQNNLGQNLTIAISQKRNYQGEAFLRLNEEQKVLLASAGWFLRIEKGGEDFRDKRLARVSLAQVKELKIERGKQDFSLVMNDGRWMLAERKDWELDQNKVREFLSALGKNSVQKFNADPSLLDQRTKKGLALTDDTLVTLSGATGPLWKGFFFKGKDAASYLRINEGPGILQVDAGEAMKFKRVQPDQFRERKILSALNPENVGELRLAIGGKKWRIVKEAETWKISEGQVSDEKLFIQKIAPFLVRLRDLEVSDFLDEKKWKDEDTQVKIEVVDRDGKSLFLLTFGKKQIFNIQGAKRELIPFGLVGRASLLTVTPTAYTNLGVETLFEEPKPSQEKK